ncbi:MAG: branched-chain amino acid ABC transporter substrate-binding protein [Streptosporangiales bacterium]|nr:branched-chain amino acid ABC transporter substrate-binding protein [Streptosporangiales bacterium]MBO0892615.1 branched-chain amino acid ABC transporter substrate-binding protein [Acidothermales bacterium]
MHHRAFVRVAVTLAAASLLITACGSRGGDNSQGGGSSEKVAKIGVIAPTSGDLSAIGLGIRDSVDLAVKQANQKKLIPGWKLQVSAEDDQANPDVGKNAATSLANDAGVVAVVGSLNSSVAQSVQPVLASAHVLMVSPANTNPSLTQGANFETSKQRPYDNYFRVCTTDAIQGPFAARYVYNKLKLKRVATINDKKTYGQGLAKAFEGEFKKLGGTIVSSQTINPDDKSFSAVISKVKPAKPQLVYYGGEYPQSGPLTVQMHQNGLNVPLMGGDGMYAADYITLAGKEAPGNYATSIGSPLNKLPAAQQYVKDYKAAGYKGDNSSYGAYAYDSATAIINALKDSLKNAKDAKSAREATVKAMGNVEFDGISGHVAFDQYGDTTNKVLTVYQVKGKDWTDVNTEEFK